MNIVSVGERPGRLALSLALVLSINTQIVFVFSSSARAVSRPAQKQASSNPNERRAEIDDKSATRARRTESQPDIVPYASTGGPIIRVALMTDVSSIALSSSSGLKVRSAADGPDEAASIPNGSITIDLRQISEPVPVETRLTTYQVAVGSSTESRGARKLADELKKKFFEPVTISFDERKSEYSVSIGRFERRSDAVQLLERIRKSGFENLRILSDPNPVTAKGSESLSDTNTRAKYKSQPASTSRSSVKHERPIKLVALVADKIAAASEEKLVVTPVVHPPAPDRNRPSNGSSGNVRNNNQASSRTSNEASEEESRIRTGPAVVRIGKTDYRGEINLVLNPRGRINVVNVLPLEEYLRGVVPMELSPGVYPEIEALKAQAVAARSYALAHLGRHLDEGFDVVDDTRAQVYGGLSAERELTNRAIDATRGIAAVFENDDRRLVPIEALYTANCGGRTENNEEVFGGKPVPYLRAVSCSSDQQSFASRDLVSSRTRDALIGVEGRSIAREAGLLSVLGFSIPRRVTTSYLSKQLDSDEANSWIQQTARLTQRHSSARTDGTRLAEFARLVAVSLYGEGRANTLLSPADIDYLLGGLRVQMLPREARADVALLLKDGILRLPADSPLDGRAPVTRGQAIETLARAILINQPAMSKSQADSKTSILRFQVPGLISEIAVPAENGRLMISSSGFTSEKGTRFTSVNTSSSGRLASSQQTEPARNSSVDPDKRAVASPQSRSRESQRNAVEVAQDAWLFRSIGGESHQVDHLSLIGGERLIYHLNDKGAIDFLEASISDRTASSDRFSSVAQWQERITVDELEQRLARARLNVGRIERIEPVAFSSSSRVTEVEVTGDENRVRLRRSQIRSTLGLKEYLFVVDRETDSRGQPVAFVFTGRGWGHGVGMCQTGAYGLAKDGFSYTSILQKYYTGVRLQRMY